MMVNLIAARRAHPPPQVAVTIGET